MGALPCRHAAALHNVETSGAGGCQSAAGGAYGALAGLSEEPTPSAAGGNDTGTGPWVLLQAPAPPAATTHGPTEPVPGPCSMQRTCSGAAAATSRDPAPPGAVDCAKRRAAELEALVQERRQQLCRALRRQVPPTLMCPARPGLKASLDLARMRRDIERDRCQCERALYEALRAQVLLEGHRGLAANYKFLMRHVEGQLAAVQREEQEEKALGRIGLGELAASAGVLVACCLYQLWLIR